MSCQSNGDRHKTCACLIKHKSNLTGALEILRTYNSAVMAWRFGPDEYKINIPTWSSLLGTDFFFFTGSLKLIYESD